MFWKFHATPSASVDELLSKENVTLEQLLDEEDIIQECKAQNSKVIDFLTQPDMLMALVSHMVTEPESAADVDVTAQYKYANMASEIVTCNIPAIIDQLAAERPLLRKLYSLLEQEPPLNPLLASFFSRTLALLIVRRPDQSWYSYQFNCLQVLEFLKSMETFIELVLRHLGTSAVMDITCNLISGIEAPEYRQNALNWLNDQRLVQRLAEVMGDWEHPERQANAGQVIVSVVTCARQMALQLGPGEREPNPLVSTIETVEFVSTLLDGVLGDSRTEAGLVNAVLVLRLLLETGRQGMHYQQNEADEEQPPEEPPSVQAVTEAVLPRLAECHRVLVNPPPRDAINTTCGRLNPPLGATRLQLARLTASLVAANRHPVNCELARLGTIDVLLDLFFQFTLNNFLHTQVEQCVSLILDSEPQESEDGKSCHPLLVHIFTKTKLVQRILQGMEEPQTNGETSEQKRCCRSLRAYCGHLVNMANKVCSAGEEGPNAELVRQQLEALPEATRASWQAFKEARLNCINEQNKPVLPDTKQDSSSDSDYRGVSDAQQAAILRTFHNFQLLNSSSGAAGADQYGGLSDDEYNDMGDALSAPPEQLTSVGLLALDVSGDQRPSAAELFEQQCAERLPASELEPWSPRRGGASLERCHSSSDEEEEEEEDGEEEVAPGQISMEVDTSDPWAEAAGSAPSPPVAMETNMWEPESTPAAGGWADFGSFSSQAQPTPDDAFSSQAQPAAETFSSPTQPAAETAPDAFSSQVSAETTPGTSSSQTQATAETTPVAEQASTGGGDEATPASSRPPPGFHTNFEAAFSSTCALQEEGKQQEEESSSSMEVQPQAQQPQPPQEEDSSSMEVQPQPQPQQPEPQQRPEGSSSMEVQPELLVAKPVQPRTDSPHELNTTGGDFTPLLHPESSPAEAVTESAADPLTDPARLTDNYSFLTSQGLMNGSAEEEVSPQGDSPAPEEPSSPPPAEEASPAKPSVVAAAPEMPVSPAV